VSAQPVRIDRERLNATIARYAEIGATEAGGVTRLALSDEDRAVRDLLCADLRALDLEPRIDDVGNISAVRPGVKDGPPVVLGSHLDTVVRGGRFDGALGVIGALEVLRTLEDHKVRTRRPVALVNWTNEEGVRFEPAMTCSGVAAGRITPEFVFDRTDRAGIRFGDELDRIGYRGSVDHRPVPASAYLELHIEQGPVLESVGKPVAVVGGIVGITWIEVTVTGQSDHAGPSPMSLRRDALMAAAEMLVGIERIALDRDDTAVSTVGRIAAEPNVINTIPGVVRFSVDFRHRDGEVLEAQVAELERVVQEVASRRGVAATVDRFWTSEPTPFAESVVDAVRDAMADLGHEPAELWSGAGHDAKFLADIVPAGMIFISSEGGLSHCEAEYSSPEDCAIGVNVLLGSALRLAGVVAE
jgi:N-carbamoyl-L-amino-acid hydrolase